MNTLEYLQERISVIVTNSKSNYFLIGDEVEFAFLVPINNLEPKFRIDYGDDVLEDRIPAYSRSSCFTPCNKLKNILVSVFQPFL